MRTASSSAVPSGPFEIWEGLTEREIAVWARLSTMKDVDILNEGDWSALHSAYAEAVAVNEDRRTFAAFVLRSIGQESLGMTGAPIASSGTYAALDREICKPYVS